MTGDCKLERRLNVTVVCQHRVLGGRDYRKMRENPGGVDAKAENLTDRKLKYSTLEASRPAARSSNRETTKHEDIWSNSRQKEAFVRSQFSVRRLDLSIYANDGQQVCEQAVHKDAIIWRLQCVLPIMDL
jgi:hypothetical protein